MHRITHPSLARAQHLVAQHERRRRATFRTPTVGAHPAADAAILAAACRVIAHTRAQWQRSNAAGGSRHALVTP